VGNKKFIYNFLENIKIREHLGSRWDDNKWILEAKECENMKWFKTGSNGRLL
jgi:hypothetical protein